MLESERSPEPLPTPTPRTGEVLAALAGALGAALSLSIGEFVSARSANVISFVNAIGEIVIDITPGSLVADSINTLGSSQKPILLGGITLAALLIGAMLGRRGLSHSVVVPVGFTVFGIVGALAGARSELTNAGGSWLVALLAAAAGASLTMALLNSVRRAAFGAPFTSNRTSEPITPGRPLSQIADRRHFLAFSGAAVGTAAVFGGSRFGRENIAENARNEILSQDVVTPTGVFTPTTGEFDAVSRISSFITPISPDDEFYVIDTALTKPQVNPDDWSLTIDGLVETPLTLTYDDLMARDMIERDVTLSCVSNSVGGGLVGNAHWRGVPLTGLLDEAGVDSSDPTTQVFQRSVDGWTCGFPTALAYDGRTAMVAVEMNGEPLPVIHGFPARVVVAGLYGYVSATKWIESITINRFDEVDGFWVPKGWSKEGPIKTQSRIDVPSHRESIVAGTKVIGGIAWSPTIGIERVEIAIGPDETWRDAELATVDHDETWVQWKYDWDAQPGQYPIRVRATDKRGNTQSPIPVAPAPNGAEGYHTIEVQVI